MYIANMPPTEDAPLTNDLDVPLNTRKASFTIIYFCIYRYKHGICSGSWRSGCFLGCISRLLAQTQGQGETTWL